LRDILSPFAKIYLHLLRPLCSDAQYNSLRFFQTLRINLTSQLYTTPYHFSFPPICLSINFPPLKMAALDIAVLAIYILALNPVLYCLWKHGKPGILGWLPLQSFCILRIVGSILDIHNESTLSTSSDSLLLANIGLSPLLLAGAGVLHEA